MFSSPNLENNNNFLCSYSFGDSWLIGKTKEGKPFPLALEENSTLHQNTPVHSNEGALCEFKREGCLIRLGAKSIFEYNAQFHVFDLNGDGILSRDELKSVRTLFISLSLATNVSKTDRP